MSEEVKDQVVETPAEAASAATDAPAAQGPDLNISDLLAVKNIIEVATSRGAFKAAELEAKEAEAEKAAAEEVPAEK